MAVLLVSLLAHCLAARSAPSLAPPRCSTVWVRESAALGHESEMLGQKSAALGQEWQGSGQDLVMLEQ